MSPQERDRFLDGDESDGDSSQGYQSEDELQKGGRSLKRRRINGDDDDIDSDVDGSSDDGQDEETAHEPASKKAPSDEQGAAPEVDEEQESSKKEPEDGEKKAKSKLLSKKSLLSTEAAIKKSGVVYLSRIPPGMKVHKLRSLLAPYGKTLRIFLSPESDEQRRRRIKQGGSRRVIFTEGWVEFASKKEAKSLCEMLNGRAIGGPKKSRWRDDVWTLLYLNSFKWHHLTEQIANENAERASRMRAEVSKANKENRAFVQNVEQGKMLDGIKSKNAAKRKRDADAEDRAEGKKEKESSALPAKDGKRSFKQTQLAKKRDLAEQPEQVTRVLSKIF